MVTSTGLAVARALVIFLNPHMAELLEASMSSVYKGRVDNVVARTIEKAANYTDNALNSWMKIDLGPYRLLLADNYTLRHGGSVGQGWRRF